LEYADDDGDGQNAIADNKVVIFAKSWCGYCRRAKQLFVDEYPDVKAAVYECVLHFR
jgi:thiol-disulfide isomerase/thioredoxin